MLLERVNPVIQVTLLYAKKDFVSLKTDLSKHYGHYSQQLYIKIISYQEYI